jgi:hypothetical protein
MRQTRYCVIHESIYREEMMSTFENLIPISSAPEKVHIAEKTLRNWRCQGIYPQIFVKLGGKVFVDISEFEKIIQRQKDEAVEKSRRLGLD